MGGFRGYGSNYGILPILAAVAPMLTGLFNQGGGEPSPVAAPPTSPLVYAALATGAAVILGGTAYLVLKK